MSKPSKRKLAKKAARSARARAKVTARRTRRAEKEAAALDPSRNLHVERGRIVTASDITPFARPKCGTCRGKGIVGLRLAGEAQGVEPCKCATSRFFKRHGKKVIIDREGRAWWPADHVEVMEAPASDAETPA